MQNASVLYAVSLKRRTKLAKEERLNLSRPRASRGSRHKSIADTVQAFTSERMVTFEIMERGQTE